jgi:hypothetical protein
MKKKLPVGIQDFEQLRERNCIYVDKTNLLKKLSEQATSYFLSRPRRFGKSLTLSTLKHLYLCDKHLFEGTWIAGEDDGIPRWNWEKPFPVVHISLGAGKFSESGATKEVFSSEIQREALKNNVVLTQKRPAHQFKELLDTLKSRNQRPVILIDEYDKPVLQVIESEFGPEILAENREELRAFYSCLKDANPEFLMITGVVRLLRASIFSELNNLNDISLDYDYATLCGITENELITYFHPHLEIIANQHQIDFNSFMVKVQNHYNGFRFAPLAPTVYNPFSTLLFCQKRVFGNYWSQSGTPSFLVRVVQKYGLEFNDFEGIQLSADSISSLNPSDIRPLPLFLQTGYLTIKDSENNGELLTLGFPNLEVKRSFVQELLNITYQKPYDEVATKAIGIGKALIQNNLEKFFSEIKKIYKGIAYQLDDATEKRYHGLFHAICVLASSPPAIVLSEVPNAIGRSDLIVDLPLACYIFEFKRDTDSASRLRSMSVQESSRSPSVVEGWAGRFLEDGTPKPVYCVGVTFGTEERNIVDWSMRESV